MLSKKQFEKDVLTGKNYPVIFGVTYKESKFDPYKTISRKGRRTNTHSDYKEFRIAFVNYDENCHSWRYVPLTKTIYWWEPVNTDVKEDVSYHLQSKYKETPQNHVRIYSHGEKNRNSIEDRVAKMTSHSTEWGAHGNDASLPSFAQWLKFHKSGD